MKANTKDRIKVLLFIAPFVLLVTFVVYAKFAPKKTIATTFNNIELLDKNNKEESAKLVKWKRRYAYKIQDKDSYYLTLFLYQQTQDNYIEEQYSINKNLYDQLVIDEKYNIKVKYAKDEKTPASLGYVYDFVKSD